MPAHSTHFPWPSYYGHFGFFEQRMKVHSRIMTVESQSSGLYQITRDIGDIVTVFICECYCFGIAEYMEVVEKCGRVDAVVINSNWCGYTTAVKSHCREQRVGMFSIGSFMAALNRPDLWMHPDDGELERSKGAT